MILNRLQVKTILQTIVQQLKITQNCNRQNEIEKNIRQ